MSPDQRSGMARGGMGIGPNMLMRSNLRPTMVNPFESITPGNV
jgi:hypothetical protein